MRVTTPTFSYKEYLMPFASPYYISPSGSDAGGAGTIGSPWFTLNKVWASASLAAGDIVYMRGGTYTIDEQWYLTGINGSSGNLITIQNYPGESPVVTRDATFDKSGGYFRGMVVQFADYIHWKGIRFTGMYTSDDVVDNAFLAHTSDNNIFEMLECDNSVAGFYLEGNCTGNLILNSDFHDNYSNYLGSNGGNSDGIALAFNPNGSADNTVRGCRSYWNGDDGFDTYDNEGIVRFDSCWSWKNGYVPRTTTEAGNGVGFKLHITSSTYHSVFHRYLTYCVAAVNKWDGYGQEDGDTRMSFFWCDAYDNVRNGFMLNNPLTVAHELKNNISYNNDDNQVYYNGSAFVDATNNSYGGGGANEGWTNDVTDADFISVTYTSMENARASNGTLPVITFLHLVEGSSLRGQGTGGTDRGTFQFVNPTAPSTFNLKTRRFIIQ